MEKPDWEYALRFVHLQGGLYAVNHPHDDKVYLYGSEPPDEVQDICSFTIPTYGALFPCLEQIGLTPLSATFFFHPRQ